MAANQQLPMLTEAEVNITDYQRYIGSLMYLMIYTCPDIVYSVGYCHGMSLILEKLICRLLNAFFAISMELAIISLNSKAMTQLSHYLRHLLILTGPEIG